MKNNKNLTIGIIALAVIVLVVLIYHSRKEPAQWQKTLDTVSNSKRIDPTPAGTTTTVKYNGYTISLCRDCFPTDGSTDSAIVYIRDKNGKLVFRDESTAEFTTLPPNAVPISKADDFITESMKDITGNGTPYLTFANWSNIRNNYTFNIIGLGATPQILLNEEHEENNWPTLINNGAGKPMSLQDRNSIFYTIKTDIGGEATISTSSLY